ALFNLLEELNEKDNELSVQWVCESEDEDNIADGKSFKEVVKIPFEIIEL
ncbi:MAG TPA: nuclear pore complex subunit, partial [Flavobacteriales bacterium]|nr:nuclear pore complex subunit [Flavobacteriales bacterium]